jgi:hypothetical protein
MILLVINNGGNPHSLAPVRVVRSSGITSGADSIIILTRVMSLHDAYKLAGIEVCGVTWLGILPSKDVVEYVETRIRYPIPL